MVKYKKRQVRSAQMKKNETLELKIHDINNLGAGVARS